MTRASHAPEIVIITGMSGAGRSTAAKSLEDLDWFVADNLPPDLLPTMVDLARRAKGEVPRIAVVVDVRSRPFSSDLKSAIGELEARDIRPYIVFLEADDDTLVRRFDSVRRPHPLQEGRRVIDGISAERELLRGMRGEADLVLDSSELNVHELRARLRDTFGSAAETALRVTVVSFGFKYGLPYDADIVFDVRFLPNPHFVDGLRAMDGRDAPVAKFVLAHEESRQLLARLEDLLRFLLPLYQREGKAYLTLALGCTGGRHRSVALVESLRAFVEELGFAPLVHHRDVDRE